MCVYNICTFVCVHNACMSMHVFEHEYSNVCMFMGMHVYLFVFVHVHMYVAHVCMPVHV